MTDAQRLDVGQARLHGWATIEIVKALEKERGALEAKVAALEQERDRADRLDAALALVTANRDHLRETLAHLREAIRDEVNRLFVEIDDARGAGLSGVSFHRIYEATDRLHALTEGENDG